jgi:hypothetical protein
LFANLSRTNEEGDWRTGRLTGASAPCGACLTSLGKTVGCGMFRNFPMLKEATPWQGFFEHEDCETLSQCLPGYLRLPLAIGFFTAVRLGEIQNLTWDQNDFLNGLICLRAGETKNDGARTILIVP